MIVARFRLYPEIRGSYYRVIIFDTRASMHSWYRRNELKKAKRPDGLKFEAIVQSYTITRFRKGKVEKKPDIGYILFHRYAIGVGIVAHEMAHAVTFWCKGAGFCLNTSRIVSRCDERYAYAIGGMNSDFWTKYYCRFPADDK